MKFRKLAIGLSVVTAINTGTPAIKVFADELNANIKTVNSYSNDSQRHNTQARINKFVALESKNLSKYDESYKIDKSNIQSITTNGRNSSGGPIEHAVDGDINTFWHTGKLNSDTFTNEVVIEFKENIDIGRIVYGNRRGIDRGFAEKFSVYGASSSDSEFVKIAEGEHKNTQDFLEIDFEKNNVKKIKFVFDKGTANWASISEMWFYKEDEVTNKMNRLFTDNTLSVVSEEFNTIEKIDALENKLKTHLLYDVYKEKLEDAKVLVESDKVVATEAKITSFDFYNNEKYNEVFKMDNSNIESVKNNAGHNMNKPLSYATDGDINTAWESNTVNSDTFKNELEIVFKEKVVLDRVVYGARQSDSKGFAEEFEIYGSKTTSGDTYELVATGKHNVVKGLIEANFNPTEFKRMKFKFKKGKDNWATISEIAFYKEDLVSEKINRLFTDNTLSVVSEEFNTIEKLEELESEVKIHPLYDVYKEKIENAKILLANEQIEPSKAITSQFELYENSAYNERFQIDKSNIKSIKNNAGHYSSQVIANAIDGDLNTYWETNKANGADFNNEVEIEFKENIVLDRIVYGARQVDTKGFAEEFEIYGSKTSEGDTYQLISTGSHNRVNGLVEAKFNQAEVKRIKFKYKKSNQNWATANEFLFYKQDELNEKLNNMFIDGTMTSLKEEFNSKEVIDLLQNEVNNHPNKERLQEFIDRAYSIINNDFDKEQIKITLPQLGDIHGHAKKNLSMSSFGTNFITTGIVAKPGEVIEVYVDANKDEPLPQIVFSQSQGHYGKWRRNYQLKPGYNKFIVPEIFDENWAHKANKGGAIYLLNPYTNEDQSKAPVVSIEGGEKFPVFNTGDNQAQFIEELKAYKEYMDANPDTAVDIFEFNSARILFTGTASDAYQVFVNEGIDVEEGINVWSDRFEDGFKFAGLEDDKTQPQHDSTNVRTAVRVMQPYGGAYAASDHIGIQKHVADDFLRTDKNSIKGIAWGTMHEVGHQMDIPARTWGEVTNNMWANEIYIKEGFGCNLDYNYIDKNVALNHNYEEVSGTNLAMFGQLEAYKVGYWSQIERMYRERKPSIKDYQDKKDTFAKYSSEIIGKNLTEYFERYGFTLSEEAKNELSKLPELDQKIWYIHSNARDYKDNGFTESLTVNVSTKIDEKNNTNTLSFDMDEENKKHLLGYEILKDGVVIGFSRTNQFVVENADITSNANYKIVPYDLKLNPGKAIDVNSFKPTIKSDEKITLAVNEEFDLKEYVVATNYKGEKLDNVEINHNIDISKAGIYNVEYKIVDNEIQEITSMQVEVVSEYDYLSDEEWKSVSTQYGTPRRNSNIKVRRNGEIKEYDKGFGIHANGEIVYDLSDKDYDTFEALLGVDMGIVSQDKSSITFKIVVDGKTVKTTNVLKHRDDAVYASVDIKGAKELKIEIYDGGNGNSSDHAVIANPKLTNNNAKPTLTIGDEKVQMKLGTEFNLLDNVVATDIEDGDLTQSINVEDGGFNVNKAGNYKVTYTVTDSDNNIVTKVKEILVYSGINYASDVAWESATTGWRTVNKDKAVGSNNKIKLKVDGTVKEFDKGIGVATNSEIVYNLEDKNYSHFTTYLGTDKNYDDNRTSIDFKILADGVEVFKSSTIRKDSDAEFVSIDLSGVRELKLIANDHDGNLIGDFASYGDTKFYITNSKPNLQIEDSMTVKVGEPIENIVGDISATDAEDGDLTSSVVVSGHENINFNKPGKHTITYTVTDSDNNSITKERTISIVDMRDSKYLTEYDWDSAVQSYSTTKKDTNVYGGDLKLTNEDGEEVLYERGIGSHANATIIYDLSDKNYDYFTSFVGVDRGMYGKVGSVSFEVHVDGEMKFDSGLMNSTDPQKFVEVDINGASELKLIVKDGGNGIGSDHATWGDTKLIFVNDERADVTVLKEAIEKAEKIEIDKYSEESINNLNLAINSAKELLNSDFVNESQCREAIKNIEDALSKLESLDTVIVIEDKGLEKDIKRTLNIGDRDITLADMHNLISLTCESTYVRTLNGLEYAVNLESLNIDYNEVNDISAIKNLKKLTNFSGLENFITNSSSDVIFENGKFIIEDTVIDLDGEKIAPKEVVLSPNTNPIKLDLNEVLVGDKVVIDSKLIEKTTSIQILYEGKYNNYQLYTFSFLSLK